MWFRSAPVLLLCLAEVLSAGAWQWSEPQPQGNGILASARSDAGTLVVVGAYSACLRLPADDNDWASVGPIAGANDLTGLAFVNGRFYAVGPRAGLWVSEDEGATWAASDSPLRGRHAFATGDRLVVLDASRSWVSASETEFNSHALPVSYRTAACDGHRIVIAGSGGLVSTSVDGENWSPGTVVGGADHVFFALAAGSEGFMLGGVKVLAGGSAYEPVLFESRDGQTWSSATPPAETSIVYQILPAPGGWIFQNSDDGQKNRRRMFCRQSTGDWSLLQGEGLDNFAAAVSISSAAHPAETYLFDTKGLLAKLGNGLAELLQPPLCPQGILYPPSFSAAAASGLALALDRNASSSDQYSLLRSLDGKVWTEISRPFPRETPRMIRVFIGRAMDSRGT